MSEEQNRERYAADLAYEYDLSLPQGRMLAELAIHALDPTFAPDSPAHLADPAVAAAYVSAPLGIAADDKSVAGLDERARVAVERGFDTAGAWFARACVAEHRGDLAAQRAHLDACLERDAAFGPAVVALGYLAFVEGDVGRAGRLLTASTDPRAHEMMHMLSHFRPRRSPVGRNERCPCGSGSKHKHCCPDPPAHPLADRAIWLWEKAAIWLRRLPQHDPFVAVGCRLAGVDDIDDDEEAVIALLRSPVIESVALLDGGLLGRFLDRLGPLLPDDERALAREWCDVGHRIWRVDATTPGTSLVLTDLGGGDTVEAVNGAVSRCTTPGELVFAAVVPTSEGWLLPCHPKGLSPEAAMVAGNLMAAGVDRLDVAATILAGVPGAAR